MSENVALTEMVLLLICYVVMKTVLNVLVRGVLILVIMEFIGGIIKILSESR